MAQIVAILRPDGTSELLSRELRAPNGLALPPRSAEENEAMDPQLGGIVLEEDTCPECGSGACRITDVEPGCASHPSRPVMPATLPGAVPAPGGTMPIVERDPWRTQYFEGVACPQDVAIPTDDPDCYELYPKHRWIYNKLLICETQGLEHGPHGIVPKHFPVFSKPIYNLRGMGSGTRILHSLEEYLSAQTPGNLWMPVLEGEHVSSDAALVNGEPAWWRHVTGKPLRDGMFDYWTVLAESRPAIESYCGDWARRHLRDYTGMLNFETIGGRIVEAHLRFSDQWPDLYGAGWVETLVRLYRDGQWNYDDANRSTGHSVVLFGGHGLHYQAPDPAVLEELRKRPHVSSIQITFHPDRPPESHAMPPGGFRLAIVNGWDLPACIAARDELALLFWSTQKLGRRRRKGSGAPAR